MSDSEENKADSQEPQNSQNVENVENVENKEVEDQKQNFNKEKTKKQPPKFVFNCIKGCGLCCERTTEVPIYIADLQRWIKDGTINYVLPFLQVKELSEFSIQLIATKTDPEDNSKSSCPFYDKENKICNIYHSMPLYCATYPLKYNGQKYYLKDKKDKCPGIGNGTMTKEWLATCRNRAVEEYEASIESSTLMPIIYGIILAHIVKKSQDAMNQLSEEDRKKIDELIEKSKQTTPKKEEEGEDSTTDEAPDENSS